MRPSARAACAGARGLQPAGALNNNFKKKYKKRTHLLRLRQGPEVRDVVLLLRRNAGRLMSGGEGRNCRSEAKTAAAQQGGGDCGRRTSVSDREL